MTDLTLGDAVSRDRVACLQAPGGSGALRLLGETLNRAQPDARVFVSDPSWANHVPLLTASGLNLTPYRYFDPASCEVDFDGMLEGIQDAGKGDVVLLHGCCCHTPRVQTCHSRSGRRLLSGPKRKAFCPFVDFAYQGFGDGPRPMRSACVRWPRACPSL